MFEEEISTSKFNWKYNRCEIIHNSTVSDEHMNIDKPIFIIGAGRSGYSVFHRIYSKHPDVALLSNMFNKFPEKPYLNRYLMHAVDIPVVGSLLQK